MSAYISLVIPVFNEIESLPELCSRCIEAVAEVHGSFELILVDDGSTDGSDSFILNLPEKHPEIIGVLLNRNYGQHTAIIAGFRHASGQIVITLDADLQNPPEEIPKLIAAIEAGADVVGTVRKHRQDSLFRKAASALINKMVQKSTGMKMSDYGCMLRAYRRSIVDAILQCRERSTFIPILANSFARNTKEITVEHLARAKGTSKYGLWSLVGLQFDLLTSMTTFPLRLLSYFGALVSLCGMGFGLALLVLRFLFGSDWAVQGVFTLFAVLFMFVGAQFVGLGLLGEYLGRIYQDVRARPRFFVREVVGRRRSGLGRSRPHQKVEIHRSHS